LHLQGYLLARGLGVLSRLGEEGDLPPSTFLPRFNALFRQRAPVSLLRHSITQLCRRQNVDWLAIGCATRLPLRSRLTPSRLALDGKPWPSGEHVFHMFYRYSSLHFLFPALHRTSRSGFPALGMLAYRLRLVNRMVSAPRLTPDHCLRPDARPVSCYALYKRIAASKLTSWLSVHPDLIYPT